MNYFIAFYTIKTPTGNICWSIWVEDLVFVNEYDTRVKISKWYIDTEYRYDPPNIALTNIIKVSKEEYDFYFV